MKTKTAKRAAAASAVAAVTAAGVLMGGLFDTPAELLAEDAAPSAYFDTLLDGDGGDGGDGGTEEQDGEELKRRGLRAGLRERILRLPLNLRMFVLLPLWALGAGVIAAGGALFSAASPLMEGVLGFVLRTAVLLGAFVLAAKAISPDVPLKKMLNRRALPCLLLGATALSALDGLLQAVWPGYAGARRIAGSGCMLLATLAAAAAYALRERKRRIAAASAVEAETPSRPDRLYCTDPGGDFTLYLNQ